jgi:anthranilate synthase component 2
MAEILVIDNYDSFTYNLVHYLEDLNCNVTVLRNNEVTFADAEAFHKILLSPGPGVPDEAGLLKPIIQEFSQTKSILGICLGQQAIAEVFGGTLVNLQQVHHGVASQINITVNNEPLYAGLNSPLTVGRYHSWCADSYTLPDVLEITSVDENGNIMSLRHRFLDVRGVQFHPESVLTLNGKHILKNWLDIKK